MQCVVKPGTGQAKQCFAKRGIGKAKALHCKVVQRQSMARLSGAPHW